jgi:hypothetical protein
MEPNKFSAKADNIRELQITLHENDHGEPNKACIRLIFYIYLSRINKITGS